MSLLLCADLKLPVDAATQTFLIVGKRGSGKTSTAVRLAEQFHHAGVPFAVVDPVDVWWGLKAAREGKGPGLEVYVFGGRHGDLPLEATAGALMADVLVEHHISVVLSVKHFSSRERDRFVGDLMERLFKRNTEPLHLFLEEAHEVAPQHPFKGEEQMLHHVRRVWKLGRSCGLGGSAITQRPASLDKNITTQAEVLVVHRTIGPQDVAAIREWIRYHGEREDILAELSGLKTGEAYVWAPDFPEGHPIGLKRVQVLERETFDSSATPRTGEKRAEPKALAAVDLERLRAKMAAVVEKAKADDPRELRRQVADLKAQLAQGPLIIKPHPVVHQVVDALGEKAVVQARREVQQIMASTMTVGERLGQLVDGLAQVADRLAPKPAEPAGEPGRMSVPLPEGAVGARVYRTPPVSALDLRQQRILNMAAMLYGRGLDVRTESVARWLGLHPDGGRFRGDVKALREAGLLEDWTVTAKGGKLLTYRDPGGPEVAMGALRDEGKRQILAEVLVAHPKALSVHEMADRLDKHPDGGRFRGDLKWLRQMGVVAGSGPLKAQEGLFR